jgi:2-polyprenyl-6-hydroxyphenyl methylase/3-demethylubiquinone-9 3-methyltransferase
MKIDLTDINLLQIEKDEITKLLIRENVEIKTDLEQMWYLMDLVWDDFHCDNKKLNWENIGKFYSHPVWLLNGLFIEQDEVSMEHRHMISKWVVKNNFQYVVDYGGGFGTLARLIAQKNNHIQVDIYEPHPSEFGLRRAKEYKNITMIEQLNRGYECLLSTDVLEHVPDPLDDFSKMINSVTLNGYLIIANAFSPMIKCHLPQCFHFRYTFKIFAKLMGLEVVGKLEGSHATIFKKVEQVEPNWKKIRIYETLSKVAFPLIEILEPVLILMKQLLKK